MKRLIALLAVLVLSLGCVWAYGDDLDFSQYTVEELYAIRFLLEDELNARLSEAADLPIFMMLKNPDADPVEIMWESYRVGEAESIVFPKDWVYDEDFGRYVHESSMNDYDVSFYISMSNFVVPLYASVGFTGEYVFTRLIEYMRENADEIELTSSSDDSAVTLDSFFDSVESGVSGNLVFRFTISGCSFEIMYFPSQEKMYVTVRTAY